MYCSNCGKKVDEARFCPYCGTQLVAEDTCRYCGEKTGGTPYCPHCGKRQNGTICGGQRGKPDKSWWIKLAAGCAAVLILFACLRSIGKPKDYEKDTGEKMHAGDAAVTLPEPEAVPVENTEDAAPEETETQPQTRDTRAEQYAEAVRLYEKRDYNPARDLFESLSGYEDSEKYLRLIRIRFSGGNIGVGSKVYRAEWGLTDSQKRDIDKAAADFYFADTAEVLVCNSDVASYYLIGDWNGGSKCYIHFITNNYGCRYNIGSKLSTNYQDTFGIYEGILYVDVVESWAETLKLTLLSPDCMEVYTYEKGGKTYVLTRE